MNKHFVWCLITFCPLEPISLLFLPVGANQLAISARWSQSACYITVIPYNKSPCHYPTYCLVYYSVLLFPHVCSGQHDTPISLRITRVILHYDCKSSVSSLQFVVSQFKFHFYLINYQARFSSFFLHKLLQHCCHSHHQPRPRACEQVPQDNQGQRAALF